MFFSEINQKYKYANHMQSMLMNIDEVDVKKWMFHHAKRNEIVNIHRVTEPG